MKYCPNCGMPSENKAVFCGECGCSLAQERKYKGKGDRHLSAFVWICAAAILLIALAAFLVSGPFDRSSSTDFIASQLAFLEERADTFTGELTRETLSSDITIRASVDGSGNMADMLSEVLDASSVVVRLDSTSGRMLLNAVLFLKGSNILEGFLKLTPDEIGFCVPNADETYYVGKTADLSETLGIGQAEANPVISAHTFRENLDGIVKRYQAVFATIITGDRLKIEKRREVRLNEIGKSVKCTVMTWEPEKDEIIELIHAFADVLETDEEAGTLLELFFTAEYGYDSRKDMLADLSQRMRNGAERIAGDIVDSGLVWVAAIDRAARIALISVATTQGEIVLERFTDSGTCTEAFYINKGRAEAAMITNRFLINGSRRTGEIATDTVFGTVSTAYDIDLSQKSVFGIPYGVYTPDLRNIAPGVDLELTVTGGTNGSTDHILSAGGLRNLTDGLLRSVDITVHTTDRSTAKEPSGKKTDISGYSIQELTDLLDDIGYGISGALMNAPEIGELMELLYGF